MQARFVLVVAVLVLTAGCLTGGGGAPESTTVGTDGANGGGASADGGDGSGDGASGDDTSDSTDAASGEWEPFAFETPARYEYEVFMEGDGEGTIVWDVESVDDGEYTVTLVYEMNGERYETTATGTKDTVVQQFYTNPGGAVLVTTMSQPSAWYEGRDLSTGTKWSYSTPQGSASFAVTGTDTIAGVDCWTSEMRVNGSVFHEACFSPDLGLAPYAAYYGEDGTLEMSLTLVAYEEN
ncbi:hypothetical protein [Halorubellus sp. PRR65]|uniref:hypothetical protein n=1 Tax=Halorubellus sp. PRR65 TaxID=3098148 RepID=UPI002B258204|nr:hypothetical protein [Halorubellus sp. PRR65]